MGAVRVPACAVLAAMLALVLAGGPAAAHTVLESSTPAAGDVLDRTPSAVSLVFTEDMDPALGAVVLSVHGQDLGRLRLSGGARATELVAAVDPGELPDAGLASWRIDYRVTSRDGHPITGSVSFRAPTPAAADDSGEDSAPSSPTPSVDGATKGSVDGDEQSESEEEAAEDREGGSLVNVLAVAGIVVLVLVLALVALRRLGREEELEHEREEHEQPEPDP